MSSINLKVNMSIYEVKKMAASAKVSKEIKTLIFDFCNKDFDKKISDDIELHILKTWFSGQKRIKMPGIKDNMNFLSWYARSLGAVVGIDDVQKSSGESNGIKFEDIRTVHVKKGGGLLGGIKSIARSQLVDNDNDGLVDEYGTGYSTIEEPVLEERNIGI